MVYVIDMDGVTGSIPVPPTILRLRSNADRWIGSAIPRACSINVERQSIQSETMGL